MPLLLEAAKIGCLAEFEELPIDLQVLALRQLMAVVREHYQETRRQLRIQRAWFEVDLDDEPAEYRVIE